MKTRIICIAAAVLAGTFGLVAGASPAVAAGTPTFSINNVTVLEGNGNGSSVMTFTVTLANPSSLNVSAMWKTVPVTASEAPSGSHCDGAHDYIQQLPSALATMNSTFPTEQISVTICADTAQEPDETFDVVLFNPTTGAQLGTATGVGTFLDDDPVPTVTVPNVGVPEPSAPLVKTVPVSVSNPSGSPITFNWATATTGSATAGTACGGTVDYVTANGQVHVPAYSTTPDVPLQVTICPAANSASESFKLNLTNYSTNVSGQTTTATVTIGGGQSGVGLFVSDPAPVSESSGTVTFDIKIIGTNHVNQFEVNFQLVDNNAGATGGASCSSGVDYVRKSGPVVFPNNGTNVIHVPVTICNDSLDENDEQFDLVVSGDTGGFNVIDPSGRATIQDDDAAPTLALAVSHGQPEGSAGGTTTLPIVWVLSSNGHAQASAKPITFRFDTADVVGSAKSGTCGNAGVDYQAVHQTVTINPGLRVGSVGVKVCAERVVEAAETFTYSASSIVNALVGNHTGTGTILNDDGSIPSIAAVTTTEGNSGQHNASLVVRLPGKAPSAGKLWFDVSGTATVGSATTCSAAASGTDYLRVTKNPVAFAAGATSVTLTFTICGDTLFEVDETVAVSVTSVDWFGTGANGTLTIHNDDPLPG